MCGADPSGRRGEPSGGVPAAPCAVGCQWLAPHVKRASKADIPMSGFPSANASPCIAAIPIRRPVNDPGPVATPNASMSVSVTPAASSSAISSPGSRAACGFDASLPSSRSTSPSRANAQLPARVVVSRARINMPSAIIQPGTQPRRSRRTRRTRNQICFS